MDWGGPFFVIAIIAISTFGWLAIELDPGQARLSDRE